MTANDEVKEGTGADILIHKAERDFIKFKIDRFLKEGDVLAFGDEELQVINTPGHTKGSICLVGRDCIFTGDTLFFNAYGRTDIAGGSDAEMAASLERLKKLIHKGMHVYPGHGPDFVQS